VQPLERLVEADRVHRSVYTDQEVFDREMENIWEKTCVYCGHESQVKKAGDYVTVQIGRQPMIMVRGMDGNIRVLFNRCPHRGVQLCGSRQGNTGSTFVCSYHAWTFHLESKGGDWVSFHRNYGGDTREGGTTYSNKGTSEAVMRSQFEAWAQYMR
jgi:nitrite reductase/ring-hydroxylating ferredoxin subunit